MEGLPAGPAFAHSKKREVPGPELAAQPELVRTIQDAVAIYFADNSTVDTQPDSEHNAVTAQDQAAQTPAAAAAASQQPLRARKRRKAPNPNPGPATAEAGSVQASSDSRTGVQGCKHASGSAKRVVVSPDGSSSVELSHRLSSKTSASENFWLHVPSNLARHCFKESELPKDVTILLTVNGQPVDHSRPDSPNPIKSLVRKRPLRSEYYIAGYSTVLGPYKDYIVRKMSVNSSGSEVTLHLVSPSEVEAAAAAEQEEVAAAVAAARADAATSGVAGWQECQGTKKVVSSTAKRSLLRVPAALISKVFKSPLPAKFKVDLSVYKDNELIGIRPAAALTPDRRDYDKSSCSVLLSEDIQQQLAGCAVICHRAAPPKFLQICFSSPAQQAREQQHQQSAAGDAAVEREPADERPADTAPAAVSRNAATTGAAAAPWASGIEALQEQQQQTQDPVCSSLECLHDQQDQQAASCKWFPWAAVKHEGSPAGSGSPPPPAATVATATVAGSTAVPVGRLGGIKGVAAAVTKI